MKYRPIRKLPDGSWLWWDNRRGEWKEETTDEHRTYREQRVKEAEEIRQSNIRENQKRFN